MKKILIIEDDSAIAEIEKDYLTLSGLDAAIITDGKKGLEEAQSGLYDLILLDLMLPGTDGFPSAAGCGNGWIFPSSSSVPEEMILTKSEVSDSAPTITSKNHFLPRYWPPA